jgi:phospholipid-binding lipoprotein MlaA
MGMKQALKATHRARLSLSWGLFAVLGIAFMLMTSNLALADKQAGQTVKPASAPQMVVNFTAAKDNSDDFTTMASTDLADPIEPFNRIMFAINDGLDIILIRPIAFVYKAVLPEFLRNAIGSFLSNVATPITLTNDLLQGEWDRAETTFVRFLINSTAGMGGLIDVAAEAGYPQHYEDFGQTLAVHGLPSGPYVVLPIIGPATPRHIVGRIADIFVNPWTYILWDESYYISIIPTAVEFVNTRADNLEALDAIRDTTSDYYGSIKSIYWQNRKSEIANGRISIEELPEIPD